MEVLSVYVRNKFNCNSWYDIGGDFECLICLGVMGIDGLIGEGGCDEGYVDVMEASHLFSWYISSYEVRRFVSLQAPLFLLVD